MTSDETIPAVGVRPLDEVFAAIDTANRRPRPWTGFEHGVLGAYRWAAGAQIAAPVTAVAAVGANGPCRAQLLAECQAAAVGLRRALAQDTDHMYVLGAHQALAWLCGLHEDCP
ncbi:hypothetical protein [Streptomyces novaecaesareae]|uniref:hypothetical protein n=1 Tax=Streptomyces novaecaesareae TaxID=68244 RepID=UPI0004AACB86|nr:hypothetical protein [Streptomyces novaecaesareae]